MADFVIPSDIFHLNKVLDEIRTNIAALLSDRDILITNQNAQQEQLSQILAAQAAQVSAISSASAQLSANIAALGAAIGGKLDSLSVAVDAIDPSLSAKIDTFNVNVSNLLSLLETMIQAFQGVVTIDQFNQALMLLGQLIQATSPERAASLRLDIASGVSIPQPIPAKAGP